jgi:hypothetical protein
LKIFTLGAGRRIEMPALGTHVFYHAHQRCLA